MKKFDMTGLRGMIEQMPTERLDEMLRYELEKEPVDEAAVRLIIDVLEERDQDNPVEINDRIEAVWEKYQAYTPVKERKRVSLRGWPMRAAAAAAEAGSRPPGRDPGTAPPRRSTSDGRYPPGS